MDFTKIIARVKAILTTPQTEWPAIAAEPASVTGLYSGYIAIVAALPAIASFIKGSLIGFSLFGVTVRTPFGMGIVGMVIGYVLSLALAYVMALIISALAPTFGGQKDQVQALKTVAYAWTAYWVAGVASIVPWLGWLIGILGGIYSIYLLYLGLPHTMKAAPEKAAGYTAVSVVIAVVFGWIIAMIIGGVIGAAALSGAALSGTHVTSSDGSVTVDESSALGKLAAMGQRAEQASKELEAAQKSGDSAAQQAAMGKVMGAVSGDSKVESLPVDQIKAFLPETLAGLKRESASAGRTNTMGMQVTEAQAVYTDGNGHSINLQVSDTGSMKGMMAMASSFAGESEKQTDHGYEKTYNDSGRMIHETWDNSSKSGEFSMIVAQRFTVQASGNADSIDQLKQAVTSVDLSKLESLKDQGVTKN
ncbi:Yip1 family protein [Dyella tabacisoli]|uniref:YIP1 family protein n=1 Tax=Dyella tabacisoli TaxID=2282381 RepID=A0A369UL34_9GAMM|nr:Yip1 family protein [Dyella tabacisoli]RDD80310.1 YIP1 family protein [Dyella tabacisoli]